MSGYFLEQRTAFFLHYLTRLDRIRKINAEDVSLEFTYFYPDTMDGNPRLSESGSKHGLV